MHDAHVTVIYVSLPVANYDIFGHLMLRVDCVISSAFGWANKVLDYTTNI